MWAKSVFDISVHNSKMFIEESSVSNEWERDVKKVLSKVAKGEQGGVISHSRLVNRFPAIQPRNMKQILAHLIESESIQIVKKERTPEVKFYQAT